MGGIYYLYFSCWCGGNCFWIIFTPDPYISVVQRYSPLLKMQLQHFPFVYPHRKMKEISFIDCGMWWMRFWTLGGRFWWVTWPTTAWGMSNSTSRHVWTGAMSEYHITSQNNRHEHVQVIFHTNIKEKWKLNLFCMKKMKRWHFFGQLSIIALKFTLP